MKDEPVETHTNPPRRGIRRGIYIIPSAFTIGNILCGFYAVINSIKGYQALDNPDLAAHLFDYAARAIGIAVLLDSLDGWIARMTKTTSDFGVELDSLADVLSFGIAPAVLAYSWGYGSIHGFDRLGWGVSFFFLICGALRLARFNMMSRSPRFSSGGSTPKLDKRYFVGLPIPAAAGMLAAVVHFVRDPIPALPANQSQFYTWVLLIGMAVLAVLMVSTLRYTSFKSIGPRSNKPFIALPLLSLLVAGIWFYSQWVLLILATVYVSHGLVLKIWGFINRSRRPFSKVDDAAATSTSIEN